MKDSIEHIAINVADIDSAVEWYISSFDCELTAKTAQKAVISFANCKLVLVLPSIERQHTAFVKRDAATYGELTPRGNEAPSTYVSDPAGNIIKLFAG
ncbi:MAG: hypothetical protein KDD66_08845 [Bdellovibrionales bacterium]|nr:hypothetical protein [Bdellovibrionales bacterium]